MGSQTPADLFVRMLYLWDIDLRHNKVIQLHTNTTPTPENSMSSLSVRADLEAACASELLLQNKAWKWANEKKPTLDNATSPLQITDTTR